MGGNRYSGPYFTVVYEEAIRAIGEKSRAIGVFLVLARYQGRGTKETAGTAMDDRAVCVPASSIAAQLSCTKAQVYSALDTLKRWGFIEVAPGCNGGKGHSAVYLINLSRENRRPEGGKRAYAAPQRESDLNDLLSHDDSCARGDSLINSHYSESESDSDSERRIPRLQVDADSRKDDYDALKPFMPNTDGFSYGYVNYMALRKRGFTAEEIKVAAQKMTVSLHKDYPDRPAKFFPHAERLLDAANPQGIYAYLDRKKVVAMREPTERDLFVFVLTHDAGDLTREAFSLNDAIVKCDDCDRKAGLRLKRDEWMKRNRDRLRELWCMRHR